MEAPQFAASPDPGHGMDSLPVEAGVPDTGGKPVWVQCRGFRCLAIFDQGKWKTFFGRNELAGEVTIIPNRAV